MDRDSKAAQLERRSISAGRQRRASTPSTRPRYQQIVDELRKEIENNKLKTGDVLPSESDLRDRFAVSRHTIREALRALREEGFVESRQGALLA
jgi:GntR family transcriptional regulator